MNFYWRLINLWCCVYSNALYIGSHRILQSVKCYHIEVRILLIEHHCCNKVQKILYYLNENLIFLYLFFLSFRIKFERNTANAVEIDLEVLVKKKYLLQHLAQQHTIALKSQFFFNELKCYFYHSYPIVCKATASIKKSSIINHVRMILFGIIVL